MLIIQTEALESGQHPIESQSGRKTCWLPGYIEVPGHLEREVWACLGWCDLTIEGGKLTGITPGTTPEPNTLSQNKEARITQSKEDLAAYLDTHPLQWTDGNFYSITAEKQAQLTSKLAVAQAKATAGVPYELKWNTTNEACVPWELNELFALAFAIDERVTALVSYQQNQEVAMREAESQEALDAIIVDYDSVGTTNKEEANVETTK